VARNLLEVGVFAAVSLFCTPLAAAPQFLGFPANNYNPYKSALISTVLDHEVPHDLTQARLPFNQATTLGPYGHSNGILSFTGELFVATATYPNKDDGCYPKPANAHQTSAWGATLASLYYGTGAGKSPPDLCTDRVALNYDDHPGYDYLVPRDTPVHPAYAGSIIFSKCIETFSNSSASDICEQYGAVAVDHGNGFVTQYMHMRNLNYGMAKNGFNQSVPTSWTLGTVYHTAPTTIGDHLHFEVLQRRAKTVDPNHYYSRKNYYIVDPYGYNTASYYGDNLLSKPGCLWATGCHY